MVALSMRKEVLDIFLDKIQEFLIFNDKLESNNYV